MMALKKTITQIKRERREAKRRNSRGAGRQGFAHPLLQKIVNAQVLEVTAIKLAGLQAPTEAEVEHGRPPKETP